MDLDKFLNLLATILGTLGAIYVMLGILAMSPDLMLRQAQTYWDFSVPQIEALASQKAESMAGFVFVVIAFILATVTIAFVPEGLRVFQSRWLALALAAVLTGGLYATLYFVSQGIYRYQKRAIGKIVISRHLDEIINRGRVEVADGTSLPFYAREFLELSMSPGETIRSIMQRLANEVGTTLPPGLDYSAVEPKR